MKKHLSLLFSAICLIAIISCQNKPAGNTQEEIVPKAAVSLTKARIGKISDNITLNGRTVFFKKNQVISPLSGYITAIHVKFGDVVETGTDLFEIQTREDRALQQSGNQNQGVSEFGKITVKSTTSGIINEPLTLGTGTYVTEGSTLCSIADYKDLQVIVNVPYEYHNLIKPGTKCTLLLSDDSSTPGTVISVRPYVEETSQTQEVLVKPSGNHPWPENMNLMVTFLKETKEEALLLPKAALLTNETQDNYWVMKMVNQNLAVKVPIQTGLKNDSLVEITNSSITPNDSIILEGGYGLEDSSLVNIIRKP